MNKIVINKALKNLADEIRLKRTDYADMKKVSDEVVGVISKLELPKSTTFRSDLWFRTGSYKFLTGVDYANNEIDIDSMLVFESPKVSSDEDVENAVKVKKHIIKELREEYQDEDKKTVRNRKPVFTVIKTRGDDGEMVFHLDFALLFVYDEKLHHLIKKNGKYELVESGIREMTDEFSETYKGDETRRFAAIIAKHWNHNRFGAFNKAMIPSIAFSQSFSKSNYEGELDYIIASLNILKASFTNGMFNYELDFAPFNNIFFKQKKKHAKKTYEEIELLLTTINQALQKETAKEAIELIATVIKGLKVPQDKGDDNDQKPGKAG